jgi:arylsulfatase
LQAPKRWVDNYVQKFGDEKPYLSERNYFPHRYPHACYAAMVSYFDEQVGEIVATLKELGLYENTLIIFSSDNGPTFNGGTDSPWFDSAKPFKSEAGWGKGNVNEGGMRVPMIAHWPGKIRPGTETDHISAFYDVLPTLSEIAGIEPAESIDGISFLPTLLGKENQEEHEYLYWEFPESGGQQAVRMGKWKGIRKNIKQDSLRVSAQNPEIVQKIESIFKKEHTPAEIERFKMKQLGD